MQRLTAYISGKVQKTGYRARVITIAQNLGLKGYVQNLDNGLVRVVAEGETANLEELLKAIDIKNALINVTDIRKEYSPATCDFDSFFKAVSGGETDQRIDVAAHLLTKLITVNEKILDVITATHEELKETHEELKETHEELKETHEELREEIKGTREEIRGSREDNRSSRDAIVGEIKASSDSLAGEVRESRDAIVGEIGELRVDLKGSIEDRLTRIESDVSQIKEKVGL